MDLIRRQRYDETEKEMKSKRREVGQAKKRIAELDRIFKRIYEDDINGTISHERFLKLSAEYEAEQRELTEKVNAEQREVDTYEIDEASRERFIYPYMEQSSYSTVDFLKRAITYFGYKPQILQTDNGSEFTHIQKTNRVHPLDVLCNQLRIEHKRIRPRTPRHNGKVERSHRNDQERFYNYLSFYSYDDLMLQMKRYLRRSNSIPMQVLGWKTPLEKRVELEQN